MADTSQLSGRPLIQVGLTCRDLDRSRAFYRDTLGLPLLFEAENMLFFQLSGLRLLIGTAGRPDQAIGGSIIYFDAPDVDEVAVNLESKGVRFTGPTQTLQRTPTGDLKLRTFYDPDGNAIGLMGIVPASK
jgi:catechol 2,3-dioxygenase-like lactoylglutathione lyase family enzyme